MAMYQLFKTRAEKHKYKCTGITWRGVSPQQFECVKTNQHRQRVEDRPLRAASTVTMRQWDGELCVTAFMFIFCILYVVGGESW